MASLAGASLASGGWSSPPPLEDTGDREVQQAEAAIGHEGLPELGAAVPEAADAEVPALPEADVPALPEEDQPGELPQPKPGPGTTEAAYLVQLRAPGTGARRPERRAPARACPAVP